MGSAVVSLGVTLSRSRSTPLLLSTIVNIAVVILSSSLSYVLESIDKLNMLLGEDLAEVIITDVDHDLLHTTSVLWEI